VQTDVFRAISDPTRRAVLERLRDSECTVTALAAPFDMSQPAISQHLRVLLDAGLVEVRQVGRERRYVLNRRPLKKVDRWLHRMITDPAGHVIRIREEE